MTIHGRVAYAVVTRAQPEIVMIGVAKNGKRILDCWAFTPDEAQAIARAIQESAMRPHHDEKP